MKAKPKRTTPRVNAHRHPARKQEKLSSKKLVGHDFARAVKRFQAEPDEQKAHEQWKGIETSIFGVRFED